MILDLDHFVSREEPFWDELESVLERRFHEPARRRSLDELQRFHYLFQRASSDLAKLKTFSGQGELHQYLEQLVARAYIALHGERGAGGRFSVWRWVVAGWPQAFRRHAALFWFAVLVTFAGGAFGAFAVGDDRVNVYLLLPAQFAHLLEDPSERVREEEAQGRSGVDYLEGNRSSFAGQLIFNNVRVAINAMAFGVLYGVLTLVVLFHNGIILGLVAFDYTRAGETEFLLGWLLPHGVPELTAIFMGGQAGLVLARAMVGWGSELALGGRLRAVRNDLVSIMAGCALMLVWAGVVEAFLSQYHYPTVSYTAKIAFGVVELVALMLYFSLAGRGRRAGEEVGR